MDRALLGRWLEQGLVREDDRELFGLNRRDSGSSQI
jgi:hypothetical protein